MGLRPMSPSISILSPRGCRSRSALQEARTGSQTQGPRKGVGPHAWGSLQGRQARRAGVCSPPRSHTGVAGAFHFHFYREVQFTEHKIHHFEVDTFCGCSVSRGCAAIALSKFPLSNPGPLTGEAFAHSVPSLAWQGRAGGLLCPVSHVPRQQAAGWCRGWGHVDRGGWSPSPRLYPPHAPASCTPLPGTWRPRAPQEVPGCIWEQGSPGTLKGVAVNTASVSCPGHIRPNANVQFLSGWSPPEILPSASRTPSCFARAEPLQRVRAICCHNNPLSHSRTFKCQPSSAWSSGDLAKWPPPGGRGGRSSRSCLGTPAPEKVPQGRSELTFPT